MAEQTVTDQPASAGLKQPFNVESYLKEKDTEGKEYLKKEEAAVQEQKNALTESNRIWGEFSKKIGKIGEDIKTPTMKELPQSPNTQYQDPIQSLGSMASVLAILGSLKTRAPLTAALNAAAGSMQGFHKGDQERVKLEREKFNDELNRAIKQNQTELQEYEASLKKANFDLDKVYADWRVIATKTNNQAMIAALDSGLHEKYYNHVMGMAQLGARLMQTQIAETDRQQRLKLEEKRIGLESSRLGETHRHNLEMEKRYGGSQGDVIPEEHRDLHGKEYLDTLPAGVAATVKAIAEGRENFASLGYRGKERFEMTQKVNQYDPNFQQGRQAAKAAVQRDFTSGTQSRNIVAINQALSHMGTLDRLGEAMKNNDINTVNRILNPASNEFGDPRVNNFELATQAVGDELMRVFRQVGASEIEAKAFQEKFRVMGSPKQIHEALKTGAELLHGRIKAVNNSWKRGMETEDDYPKLLDPEPKEVLTKRFGIKPLESTSGSGWNADKERRYQELLRKKNALE